MVFFSDLTEYSYLRKRVGERALNVGWLDKGHPIPTGEVSEEILNALFDACLHPVNRMRGFHKCQFCRRPPFGLKVSRHGKDAVLGSAEIRAVGNDGITYAAPDLIFHYVMDHSYKPPEGFLTALLDQTLRNDK